MPSAVGDARSELPVLGLQPQKIAIVAALQREVWPLVKGWRSTVRQYDGREHRFFEHDAMVVICGGIGAEHARRATEAVINLYGPKLVVSAGFAGALVSELKVGDLLVPHWVTDAKDGSRFEIDAGEGSVLTVHELAGAPRKRLLAEAYGAKAVDMEAAAVARGAASHGVSFLAIKVISDDLDFAMPPVGRFVNGAGEFKTAQFALYAALRPWLWKAVIQLGRNSARASHVLRNALKQESILPLAASNRGTC